MKKVIYGFDILKFFMAMMVALGHLKGLVELPSVEKFFGSCCSYIFCYFFIFILAEEKYTFNRKVLLSFASFISRLAYFL